MHAFTKISVPRRQIRTHKIPLYNNAITCSQCYILRKVVKRRNIWCVNNSLTCRNVFRSRAVGGNSDLCETFFKHSVEFKGETLFSCQSKGGGRCMVDVLPVLKNKKPSYVVADPMCKSNFADSGSS